VSVTATSNPGTERFHPSW